MPSQYRYDYQPDAVPVEQDSRALRDARQQVQRRPGTQVGQLQQQLEQQLGIGSRTVQGAPARLPMRTMEPPAGMPPAPRPPANAAAPIAPATQPKMDASQAAAHFLAEARQQMDVLNAGRRDGSIDANLDRQMMSQINHLLNLHNEARSYINTMPAQPSPQPQQAPPPKPSAPKPQAKPAAKTPSSKPAVNAPPKKPMDVRNYRPDPNRYLLPPEGDYESKRPRQLRRKRNQENLS
jgi:hypothetical protein